MTGVENLITDPTLHLSALQEFPTGSWFGTVEIVPEFGRTVLLRHSSYHGLSKRPPKPRSNTACHRH